MGASDLFLSHNVARATGRPFMDVSDLLLTPQSVIADLKVASKAEALAVLAERAAGLTGLEAVTIYHALVERERLGTTGVGHGVAIPHARMPALDRMRVVFARLAQPINFEAVDEQPVDLLFLVLSSERAGADHLKALARISRLLHDAALCRKLRGTDTVDGLCGLLIEHLTH